MLRQEKVHTEIHKVVPADRAVVYDNICSHDISAEGP
jgi:hypothetical protein